MTHKAQLIVGAGLAAAVCAAALATNAQEPAHAVVRAGAPLAADIDPGTMSRLPLPTAAEM
ncbi:MAG TPA: hypothetical protein VG960_12535, partial [Caulobacteraceae bacterium]|nr:hypothetical protein [Caulobacteraceae bacterium]